MDDLLRRYLNSTDEEGDKLREALLSSADHSTLLTILSERGDGSKDFFADKLQPLLNFLVKKRPDLLLDCEIHKFRPGERWALYVAGISSQDLTLREFILSGLEDRALDIRLLVVQAITSAPMLRTVQARNTLEKLLTFTSLKPYESSIRAALLSCSESGAQTTGTQKFEV